MRGGKREGSGRKSHPMGKGVVMRVPEGLVRWVKRMIERTAR